MSPRPVRSPVLRRLRRARRVVRRLLLARRRLLAAVLVAVAVVAGVRATRPPAPPSDLVLVAAHDLAAGTVLDRGDLGTARYADGTAPQGLAAPEDALGRTLAAPLRAGEPVTDVRLVGAGLLLGYPGRVALPVRIPDADVVALLRVGDTVDVLATDPRGGATERVAAGVPVVALPSAGADQDVGGTGLTGRLVVVGVRPGDTDELAGASAGRFLSLTLLR